MNLVVRICILVLIRFWTDKHTVQKNIHLVITMCCRFPKRGIKQDHDKQFQLDLKSRKRESQTDQTKSSFIIDMCGVDLQNYRSIR